MHALWQNRVRKIRIRVLMLGAALGIQLSVSLLTGLLCYRGGLR